VKGQGGKELHLPRDLRFTRDKCPGGACVLGQRKGGEKGRVRRRGLGKDNTERDPGLEWVGMFAVIWTYGNLVEESNQVVREEKTKRERLSALQPSFEVAGDCFHLKCRNLGRPRRGKVVESKTSVRNEGPYSRS